MRILITGCTGFVGGYLAEALLSRPDVKLFGVSRRSHWSADWQHLNDRMELRSCDLSARIIEEVVRDVKPERIFHLAGYAHVGQSFREVAAAWAGNLTASLNLYEAVVRAGGKPRVLHVSSGLVYGDPQTPDQLFDERCLLCPVSPYAASKAAADLAAYQYTRAPGVEIVRVRPFNHIGPRQSSQYAVPHFAQQIAAIERGWQQPFVETGNLSPRRDLTDVRDMVQAYLLLMDRGQSGEVYNAGSGESHSMQAVLDRLLALAKVKVEVRQQAKWLRTTESTASRADAGKLRALGWTPRYTLEQTLADTLEYWRASVVRRS